MVQRSEREKQTVCSRPTRISEWPTHCTGSWTSLRDTDTWEVLLDKSIMTPDEVLHCWKLSSTTHTNTRNWMYSYWLLRGHTLDNTSMQVLKVCHIHIYVAQLATGNIVPIGQVPEGTVVCNIEEHPGDKGALSRATGCYGTIIGHAEDGSTTRIRLPSGTRKTLNSLCRATVGMIFKLL